LTFYLECDIASSYSLGQRFSVKNLAFLPYPSLDLDPKATFFVGSILSGFGYEMPPTPPYPTKSSCIENLIPSASSGVLGK
jgi:hypothetical protein